MAEAGLRRRTRYATATLVIGANFPDIDVAVIAFGDSIALRRGWTHGLLALAVLPFLLTAVVLTWHSWRNRRGGARGDPPDARQLLLLAGLSILTHPTLDFMNTYGVRWLMPFVDRWYHGDTLFIVDVWLWIALLVGAVWSRRAAARMKPEATRAARVALGACAIYVMAMAAASAATRSRVEADLVQRLGTPPARVMVSPVPFFPHLREVVFEEGDSYGFGLVGVTPGDRLDVDDTRLMKGDDDPAVLRVQADPRARAFLHWARFPFFRVERARDTTYVSIVDARYGTDPARTWAAVRVALPTIISSHHHQRTTETSACFESTDPAS